MTFEIIMQLTYRQLTPHDAAAFKTLRLESLQRYPNNYTSTYETEAGYDDAWFAEHIANHELYGAWDGDILVATARLTKDTHPRSDHKAVLSAVYVTQSYQRRGIARTLLHYVLKEAPKTYEQLLLAVDSENHAAMSLYEQLGFTTYGHEKHALKLDDGYLDDILMVKFL